MKCFLIAHIAKPVIRYRFPAIALLCLFCTGFSHNAAGQRATRQSAMEMFSRGDYAKAYSEFSELLGVYSKDPLYKYYASVCLIKLERDPVQAEALIKQAVENNSAARPLPADATFYHARALQMNGSFSEAAELYGRFAARAGRKTAREYDVQGYVQQCAKGEGAVAATKTMAQVAAEPGKPVGPAGEQPFAKPATEAAPTPLDDDYSGMLDRALALQFSADSLKQTGNEKAAAPYQESADEMFAAAHEAIAAGADDMETPVAPPAGNHAEPEEAAVRVAPETQNIYSYFEITGAPAANTDENVEVDTEAPEGLNYRIQVAVFRNPVSAAFFKGITPVYGIGNEGSELKTYYAGMFRRMADARSALTRVKNLGFKDSFIVSFSGNSIVSPDRAAALEKEWGTKPLAEIAGSNSQAVAAADTLPPTLVFRVETMRVAKEPKPDVVESLRTLAGSRGLDIVATDDKKIACLIGRFITFASAAEYADLLIRNGYRDSRVTAWLGNREVPLETAKQLFESIE
ncbi:MAG: hypothetical protein LBV26_02115 [Bacteroidales bacterium]|nr:hypothetical protein [Bacteroidales bacterium]